MRITNPFHWKHYERLIAIPLVLIALSLVAIFVFPGIKYGLDFKGGTLVTIFTSQPNPDVGLLKQKLAPFSSSVDVRGFTSPDGVKGLEVELAPSRSLETAGDTVNILDVSKADFDKATLDVSILEASVQAGTGSPTQLDAAREKASGLGKVVRDQSAQLLSNLGESANALPDDPDKAYDFARGEYSVRQESYQSSVIAAIKQVVPVTSVSVREVGSTLSRFFFSKAFDILLYSFLLSSIVVFIVFRSRLPSFAVVFGAVSDIVITLGVMAVLGLPLSLASFAALLMLIAFSLDTDILLTVRVLKRTEGTPEERAYNAMKAALTINVSTVVAYGVLLIISLVLNIPTYFEIASVAVIGGVVDFIATWFGNAVIVLHYVKRT